MVSPHEKLAESLKSLRALQGRGVVAVRSGDLTRTHQERLVKNGFLQKVMKGWYIPARPDDATGESTAWYASFWGFCAAYLQERFGTNWRKDRLAPVLCTRGLGELQIRILSKEHHGRLSLFVH
jgi:hypothetical protein